MVWTDITCKRYEPPKGLMPSDLSDAQWVFLEPLLPSPTGVGRPRTVDLRHVLDAILYIATTGCQ